MPERLEIWGVKDPNISAQLALAARLDLFKRVAGLEVTCEFMESGTTMPDDVLNAPERPFAFTQTPITSILLHDKGLSTKLIAPLADIAGTQQVIIHEASGISQPKDLEGKQIGMAQGAAVYIALRNMAKDCNVNLKKATLVNLLPHDQLAAFGDGKLDAIACWEPWTTKAQTMGGKFYFSGSRSEIPGMEGDVNWLVNQSCLIVPDENLEKHPEVAVAILRVLKNATDLLNQRRKDVSKVLATFFGISRLELMMAMQKNKYFILMDNLFRIGVLGFRDFLHENGRVSSSFSEDILYETKYLKQVDPSFIRLGTTGLQNVNIIEKNGVYYQESTILKYNGDQLKFLLADDSRYVRVALTQAVKIIGGEVVGEASNGDEAIDKFKRLHPNFITMDLSMPGVSGVDAIKGILQSDPTANIIVVSGTNLKELREEVFQLGAKVFITKPFDPMQIATIIGSLVM
jgi:ABC-type nitrate/sulfonate/bicarbonate transport system substrate-binding protein/CheY-like chemotaxis protein